MASAIELILILPILYLAESSLIIRNSEISWKCKELNMIRITSMSNRSTSVVALAINGAGIWRSLDIFEHIDLNNCPRTLHCSTLFVFGYTRDDEVVKISEVDHFTELSNRTLRIVRRDCSTGTSPPTSPTSASQPTTPQSQSSTTMMSGGEIQLYPDLGKTEIVLNDTGITGVFIHYDSGSPGREVIIRPTISKEGYKIYFQLIREFTWRGTVFIEFFNITNGRTLTVGMYHGYQRLQSIDITLLVPDAQTVAPPTRAPPTRAPPTRVSSPDSSIMISTSAVSGISHWRTTPFFCLCILLSTSTQIR